MQATLAKLVWPGMILAGFALAAFVWTTWPEPTLRVVRLPYGESMPKTPHAAASPQRAAVVEPDLAGAPSAPSVPRRAQAAAVEPAPARVLAAVQPDPTADLGPAPVPSELESSRDYEQESPEELGAEPLPGVVLTPEAPPAAG